jgi:hypothetical protein
MRDKMRFLSLLLVGIMLVSLTSCITVTKSPTGASAADGGLDELEADDDEISSAIDEVESIADSEEDDAEPVSAADSSLPKKTVTEGEKVSFPNLKASDPDGDPITYTFSSPLNKDGEWETEKGDAGNYRVTITASDGVNKVSQDVMVVVLSANKAPVIEGLKDVTVNEGDTVSLSPTVTDPEGDEVTVTYSGWMASSTKGTTFADAGTYTVKVTATDGESESVETVKVTVLNVNRQPALSVSDVTIEEGETVSASATASDPDGDSVTVEFSEPLDEDGEWETDIGDAGKYRITATATDGDKEVTKSFFVIVTSKNKAPVLSGVTDIEADEGETISLSVSASDEDEDEVSITYPAPFTAAGKWATGYDDAGIYTLTVSATDGISTTEETFTVVVNDMNRAPTFGEGAFD